MGLYPTVVKEVSNTSTNLGVPLQGFGAKLVAGALTGAVGATAGNPTDQGEAAS